MPSSLSNAFVFCTEILSSIFFNAATSLASVSFVSVYLFFLSFLIVLANSSATLRRSSSSFCGRTFSLASVSLMFSLSNFFLIFSRSSTTRFASCETIQSSSRSDSSES